LQRGLNDDVVALVLKIDDATVDGCFVAVEMRNEGPDTALVLEYVFFFITFVAQLYTDARVEERQLTQPAGKDIVVIIDVGEGRRAGLET
jgi:hypothetical protein